MQKNHGLSARMLAGAAVGLLGISATAMGVPIAFDSFEDYDLGAMEDNSGVVANGGSGDWVGTWDVANDQRDWANVVARQMSYTSGAVSVNGGNQALRYTPDLGSATVSLLRTFTWTTDAPVYLSFLMQAPTITETTSGNSTNDFIQVGFDAGNGILGGGGNTRASAGVSGSPTPEFFARSTTSSGTSGDAVDPEETYFIVLRLEKLDGSSNYNRVVAFINPGSLNELDNTANPPLVSQLDSGISGINKLLIRTARVEVGDEFYFDHFRIGDSFATVIPEPAAITLLAGVAVPALLRRRHRDARR